MGNPRRCIPIVIILVLFFSVYISNRVNSRALFLDHSFSSANATTPSIAPEVFISIDELLHSCETAFSLSFPDHVSFDYDDARKLLYVWITIEDDSYQAYLSAYRDSQDVTEWYTLTGSVEDLSREWQTEFQKHGHTDITLLTSIVHPTGSDTNLVLARFIRGDLAEDNIDNAISVSGSSVTTASTFGQENALRSAKSYLSLTSFSWSGLVKQLEFEGYTHDEAVFAANSCGADWNEQAAKAAKSYLQITSFSRSGLIDQLEYEGFTHDQAVYGAVKAGY